ncbi:CocE/NonD family hydrolase C-terminal non-catalytic domain-containing protein [Sphingomonas sp. PvP055]
MTGARVWHGQSIRLRLSTSSWPMGWRSAWAKELTLSCSTMSTGTAMLCW